MKKPYDRGGWTAAAGMLAALAGLGWLALGAAQEPGTAEVMRRKLDHSQRVLRALATADFAAMETNALRLVRLSEASGWSPSKSAEYPLFTQEFRRAVEELAGAARGRNIDAATVAYTQLTFSCVACHKHLRGRPPGQAAAPLPPRGRGDGAVASR
ncbi:MAG: hypothetical protein ACKOET_16055 [Verrucomicrobiota bacterium]